MTKRRAIPFPIHHDFHSKSCLLSQSEGDGLSTGSSSKAHWVLRIIMLSMVTGGHRKEVALLKKKSVIMCAEAKIPVVTEECFQHLKSAAPSLCAVVKH